MSARPAQPVVTRHSLEALLVEGRMPLDAALQLAHGLVKALESLHGRSQALGAFDASSITVDDVGTVTLTRSTGGGAAPELTAGGEADLLSDVYSLGGVFFWAFSGLTAAEATKRSGGHLPPPSRFNPTLDDSLDGLVLTMLDADPMERPYRLALVEAQLNAFANELGLEVTPNAIATWVAAHRPAPVVQPVVVAAPAPVKPAAPKKPAPRVTWALEEEDDAPESAADDSGWEGPVRFDLWAAASAGVVALGIALVALF